MKNKKNMRRFLSGFLAMLTVLSTILSPILSYAADVVPEEPPLYEKVKNELDADEVVKAKDLELETGSIFEVEKDFTGLEIPDEKKVKITFHEAKNEEKQDFTTDYEDTYKAVYYVEPVSGHPIYQINRKLIVKEAVVQVAESENQESVSNQEDENEAEGEEPAIGTAESEEPVQDEVNVEIPSEDKIYEEVTPTEIPVEEEPIDTPIPENPSEEVSTEEPAIDDNPDTDSTFEEITDTDPEEMPEATDDSFTDETEKTEDADGNYQVNIVRGEEFHIELNHEDGQYQPGETVVFSGDMPQGSLIAVGTTKVQANQTENTEDLLYSEVTYHEESDKFSFEMPADDIDLSVSMDQAENGIMLLAADTPWDDATNIEANKYYYYSDGQLHPFDTVMGQGGNDSYKYVRYKAGGKTYTVNAYCMQHSMQSPPSGTTYKNMVELDEGGDDKYLRKALFYGYGGPGWGHTFNGYNVKSIMEKYGCSSETRAMQHYLVDYLYDGESGFGGALSTTAKNMLKEIKAALAKMPDPTAMKLLPGLSVNATGKETESFTWKANEAFTITITVSDTADVQKVEMKDAVPVGRIIINKKGEFVKEVTWKDMLAGGMDAAFGYVTGSLKDVTFEIYAAEDIKAADGESSDYYKKDELVATITTDALGYARSEDLPLGKYYVKEKETADGYVLDGEIREVDLTYRDQNTPVVTYDEDWQNNRQKAKVTVVKKEKNTDRVLEGGVFALYTKNDILNAEGEVILKADTMIEQKATDQDGRIVFTADLPINGSYYVKEVQAPAGFVTTEEIKEFDFAYAGEEVAEVSFEFTYEDEPTTFEITKSDITTGEELPGAKLKVSDSEGNVVDEWTSGSTPHIIKELEVGKKYTLTETIPADGYATAESITFVVENTADIQKVEMQDDTTKILISKVDMTDGSSEVKGAKLYILNENQEVMESWTSGDQPHYVEKLSVGTYTLLEETAPKGYIVANKVTFEVKDTGDVQGAKMEDEQAMGKVILNKTDKDTKKPMKGVEFALCDSKGKVLETLVTDSAGHAESKNYPIATFKNGQYKKAITYEWVEEYL